MLKQLLKNMRLELLQGIREFFFTFVLPKCVKSHRFLSATQPSMNATRAFPGSPQAI
jgi:hypothetical protein